MDQQVGGCAHQRLGHRTVCAVWEHVFGTGITVGLDDREDVVPAAGVETGSVVTQLVQDLFHLEGRGDGFDKDCGTDGALRDPEVVLRLVEYTVPPAGCEMV